MWRRISGGEHRQFSPDLTTSNTAQSRRRVFNGTGFRSVRSLSAGMQPHTQGMPIGGRFSTEIYDRASTQRQQIRDMAHGHYQLSYRPLTMDYGRSYSRAAPIAAQNQTAYGGIYQSQYDRAPHYLAQPNSISYSYVSAEARHLAPALPTLHGLRNYGAQNAVLQQMDSPSYPWRDFGGYEHASFSQRQEPLASLQGSSSDSSLLEQGQALRVEPQTDFPLTREQIYPFQTNRPPVSSRFASLVSLPAAVPKPPMPQRQSLQFAPAPSNEPQPLLDNRQIQSSCRPFQMISRSDEPGASGAAALVITSQEESQDTQEQSQSEALDEYLKSTASVDLPATGEIETPPAQVQDLLQADNQSAVGAPVQQSQNPQQAQSAQNQDTDTKEESPASNKSSSTAKSELNLLDTSNVEDVTAPIKPTPSLPSEPLSAVERLALLREKKVRMLQKAKEARKSALSLLNTEEASSPETVPSALDEPSTSSAQTLLEPTSLAPKRPNSFSVEQSSKLFDEKLAILEKKAAQKQQAAEQEKRIAQARKPVPVKRRASIAEMLGVVDKDEHSEDETNVDDSPAAREDFVQRVRAQIQRRGLSAYVPRHSRHFEPDWAARRSEKNRERKQALQKFDTVPEGDEEDFKKKEKLEKAASASLSDTLSTIGLGRKRSALHTVRGISAPRNEQSTEPLSTPSQDLTARIAEFRARMVQRRAAAMANMQAQASTPSQTEQSQSEPEKDKDDEAKVS